MVQEAGLCWSSSSIFLYGFSGSMKGFFAWPTAGGIWTASQLPGGVGPIYDWPKLLLWGLHYQKIIFLDADTLPITPDALERLASPLGTPSVHFVAVGFHEGREINNGVFALRPSQQLHRCLSRSAEAGTYFRGPFAEEFRRRGGTWMAFLDLFWQHEAFPCSGAQHVLVSQVFNFPASLGSIFQVRDARNQSSPRFVAEQWSKVLVESKINGVQILHWVGRQRKPWLHWAPPARSALDRLWWLQHERMCRWTRPRQECRLHCRLKG
ncbi:unnamed protein product [Durusdinium trenchii]|uniref:Nucleotide-diphospho-sugar transferase domain-containing protein n=1 Tax=Durusdinium trenchii TaxID=1381693 RepID=A0ABP0H7A5_9DINO